VTPKTWVDDRVIDDTATHHRDCGCRECVRDNADGGPP
jgi:hypothetical protein